MLSYQGKRSYLSFMYDRRVTRKIDNKDGLYFALTMSNSYLTFKSLKEEIKDERKKEKK